MALIGRLFVILFGFFAACLVAGMIVVTAVLFPEFSDLGAGPVDPAVLNIVLGFGFIFISGFALLPALLVVAITEAFYIRSVLAYAVGGGLFIQSAHHGISVAFRCREHDHHAERPNWLCRRLDEHDSSEQHDVPQRP